MESRWQLGLQKRKKGCEEPPSASTSAMKCLFLALLPCYKQYTEKAERGEREVVLSWCTTPSSGLAPEVTENQANSVEKTELPTIFK